MIHFRRPPHLLLSQFRSLSTTGAPLEARRWKENTEPSFKSRFHNPVSEVAGMNAPNPEKPTRIYDNKPHKVRVEKYNRYFWCGCGFARTEPPFCDFTCQNLNMKRAIQTGPVEYIAPETKDIWFCNCKQTNNRPFCDGSHRSEEVQSYKFDHRPQFWEPRSKASKDDSS